VVFIALGWGGLIFMIAVVVVPAWAVSVFLCAASIVLAVIDGRTRAKAQGREVLRKTPRPYGFAAYALVSLAAVGCVFAVLGDVVYGATYTVLTPVAPNGCTAVVRETSFFNTGEGEVHAVHPSGLGWRTSSWTADDGARPVEDGLYELSWNAGGSLEISGDGQNPVWPNLHDVNCL